MREQRRTHLDGVADEVGDDLLEPEGVADEVVRDARVDVVDEVELVLRGLRAREGAGQPGSGAAKDQLRSAAP